MTSRKGTKRELYIAEKFQREGGWITVRKYASIGSYDFIAFRKAQCAGSPFGHDHSEMLAIQVKGTPWELTEEGKNELIKDADYFGARPVWVYREIRKSVLGFTKAGKQRTQARWITVYLDEHWKDFTKIIPKQKGKKVKSRKLS